MCLFGFVLIGAACSALVKGQNPYVILGIDRQATPAQIKRAFHAKAKIMHPDRNKEPDAHKKWIQITDAFELLSDPKQRERYDKFGLVDESLDNAPKADNRADKLRTIISQDMASRSTDYATGEFDLREKLDVVKELDDKTFEQTTSDERPWLIYVYTADHDYQQHRYLFEDLHQKTGILFGIARMRTTSSQNTVKLLKIRTTPQLVIYDPQTGRTSLYSGEMKVAKITRFAAQKFGAEITEVHNDHDILVWRRKNLDRIHIILFSDLQIAPANFELSAAFLKYYAVFAYASISQKNIGDFPSALGSTELTDLPTYVIYRMGNPEHDTFGGPVTPLVAPMDLDAGNLAAIVRRLKYPGFAELTTANFDRLCNDVCVIFCAGREIAEDILNGVNDMSIQTGLINLTKETEFQARFGLEPGDFLVLKPAQKQWARWREITTWMEFRKKLELTRRNILRLSTADELPKILNAQAVSRAASSDASQIAQQLEDIRFMVGESMTKFYNWVKTLPAVAIILLIGGFLLVIGEIVELCVKCCCAPKKDAKKKDLQMKKEKVN